MVFTDTAIEYFSLIGSRVRAGLAESNSATPFYYEEESFHNAYEAITQIWKKRQSISRHFQADFKATTPGRFEGHYLKSY